MMAPRFRRVHRGDVGGREEILESGGCLRNLKAMVDEKSALAKVG